MYHPHFQFLALDLTMMHYTGQLESCGCFPILNLTYKMTCEEMACDFPNTYGVKIVWLGQKQDNLHVINNIENKNI